MKTYYAAADIGASGGRLILGALEDGQLRTQIDCDPALQADIYTK